jgi:hypothetical protein
LGLVVPILFPNCVRKPMTHNPNLAVVCDAEQIFCASIRKANNYRTDRYSGSIENPTINRTVVDILEGIPRFQPERGSKTNGGGRLAPPVASG